jgi:hypothetical protein
MSESNSAVSLSTGARRFCMIAALAAASIALLPGDARAQERRACRATGYFLFTLDEYAGGSVTTRAARINILPSDMEVVATSTGQAFSTVTDAKRWACSEAAQCFVLLAAGADGCSSRIGAVFETMKRPDNMEAWRRQVACNHARAGSISGLRQTSTNKVILVKTHVVATGSRDGVTRLGDRTIDESDHLCWSPPAAPGNPPAGDPTRDPNPPRPKPSRTDADHQPRRTDSDHQPSRTDSSHQPSRTDDSHRPSRTNAPSPIESIKVTVTPSEQKGKCPASVLMQARLELSRPVEVRWWVTGEGGYQSPKYVRAFTKSEASLIWRRHINPQPTAPIHRGYFQLHFETVSEQDRGLPLGESERASFTVDCHAEPPNKFKPRS